MPKTIIREFDNSKTGITLSSNFAVFVPGYLGTPKLEGGETAADVLDEAKKIGIYYDTDNIYKLNSQSQFIRYIGKFGGDEREAKAPVLELINESAGGDDINKYRKTLTVKEFTETTDASFYKWDTAEYDPAKPYGHLRITFTVNGENETILLTKVSKVDLYDDLVTNEQGEVLIGETSNTYFKIKDIVGNEGLDAVTNIDHMGNQIAWELLGLGYTVYFKGLSKDASALDQLATPDFWSCLKNKSTYRIRYITTGGCYDSTVAAFAAEVAKFVSSGNESEPTVENSEIIDGETGRGDCIALLDVDEELVKAANPVTQKQLLTAFGNAAKLLPASKYTAIFAPHVVYKLSYGKNGIYSADVEFPGSFHYLACAAYAQQRYAEWYAVAGYTRGISTLAIAYPTYTFGDISINTLAPRVKNSYIDRSINLLLSERGNYYLWGNRTSELLNDDGLKFSHFLNIRQLCCTIKQVLYEATRRFTFDPNSDLLWINFVNAIRPTLENMKADQGISGYKISRVETDKKALLVARIRIVPIEAVEDFDISIYLEDSLSGIVVAADEEEAE